MKLKVGFIYGGISTEHEISIISAIQAINNMNMDKYDIVPIYLSKKGVFYTGKYLLNIDNYKDLSLIPKKCKEVSIIKKNNDFVLLNVNFPHKVLTNIDIFFPIVHGYNTEDGSIAGFLETIGAPYAESDLYASLIGQDKVIQKMVFKENGINIAPYTYFYENEYLDNENEIISKINKLSYPVIVKPARLGSSVGINIALDESSLNEAINEALKYDEKIIVEKVIENLKELNCSVLGDKDLYKPSLIEEVSGKDNILSYEDKYISGGKSKGMASASRKVPADIPKKLTKEIENISVKACKALNTNGIVRIDYLYDTKNDKVYNKKRILSTFLSIPIITYLFKNEQSKEYIKEIDKETRITYTIYYTIITELSKSDKLLKDKIKNTFLIQQNIKATILLHFLLIIYKY